MTYRNNITHSFDVTRSRFEDQIFLLSWETKLFHKMEDFTGYFDLAFEIDKLFEENDDTFEANDFLFNYIINKETKPITNKVQEDTGPNIPACQQSSNVVYILFVN